MRLPHFVFAVLLAGAAFGGSPASGAPTNAVTPQSADSLFQLKDWVHALSAYETLARREPQNGRFWYRLGHTQYGLKHYREAVDAWTRSEAIGHNPTVMYNLGVGYALLGDKDRAFEWLDKAAAAGFSQEAQLAADADLASLRGDPRYARTAAAVHASARPCETRAEAHQFDFWIGDWDVQTQSGQPVGKSHIEQILGQCVIFENWTGLQGSSGKSFNSFDTVSGTWRQFWVDDSGTVTEFTDGRYLDHVLTFATLSRSAGGGDILGRLSFTDMGPDRVRQWKERSVDAGVTWTTDYDFIYVRRKS